MVTNYGGCAINRVIHNNSVDVTDWDYYIQVNSSTGERSVWLYRYKGSNSDVVAPVIQQ